MPGDGLPARWNAQADAERETHALAGGGKDAAASLLLLVAGALAYTHQRNIVHWDVKPSNILIGEKDRPMLTDFGIAKILESEDDHT
jgi:serine/threonine protein kinase